MTGLLNWGNRGCSLANVFYFLFFLSLFIGFGWRLETKEKVRLGFEFVELFSLFLRKIARSFIGEVIDDGNYFFSKGIFLVSVNGLERS